MSMLDRKLMRDLALWRGQIVAIAAVAACGIMSFVTMQSNYDAMYAAQNAYYHDYAFADLFANVTRAPRPVDVQLAAIPNVTAVDTRVVTDVLADLPGRSDAATLRLIGIPDGTQPKLNRIYLRSGRLPSGDARDEAVISAAFSDANHVKPGSSLAVIINGRKQRLRIVGVGLSPEYVYEMRGGGDVFPDSRHFGIAWMNDKPLAAAFDMTDAFNDVSFALSPGANEAAAIERVDRVLAQYGSLGAYGRADQFSARFVTNELGQLRAQAIAIPLIFLGIASFLINAALARLVATQREQIAVLKAFGYGNIAIGVHYIKAALVAVALGSLLGVLGGWWMGFQLAVIYTKFFRFPATSFALETWVVALAVAISVAAATLGAMWSVRAAATLPPAVAMRPPVPLSYRRTLLERLGLTRFFPGASRMMLRTIERRPVSSAFTLVAVAFSVAILVVGRSTYDSVESMMTVQFEQVSREDATIVFVRALTPRAAQEVRGLPGVLSSEPFRNVFARVSNAHRSRRLLISGVVDHPSLHRIVGGNADIVDPSSHGIVMTAALARILGVSPGATVGVEILEGRRQRFRLPVTALVDELIGLNVYMRASELNRLLGEDAVISGAYMRLDPRRAAAFDAAIKQTPNVSGVSYRKAALDEFQRSFAESIGISAAFILGFAAVIASGVVYNSGRVALSERARELSTLRILGYEFRDTAVMLVGEQALLTVAAIPLGFFFGAMLNRGLQPLYEMEYYRVPLVTSNVSYVIAALFTLAAAGASGLILTAQLRRMSLVVALKSGE